MGGRPAESHGEKAGCLGGTLVQEETKRQQGKGRDRASRGGLGEDGNYAVAISRVTGGKGWGRAGRRADVWGKEK